MDRKQERAFEVFVAESGDSLLRLATLLTSDTGLGEDVYQETLHRLAARWSRVGNPRAFCRQVMHNIVIDQARLQRRQVPRSGWPPSTTTATLGRPIRRRPSSCARYCGRGGRRGPGRVRPGQRADERPARRHAYERRGAARRAAGRGETADAAELHEAPAANRRRPGRADARVIERNL